MIKEQVNIVNFAPETPTTFGNYLTVPTWTN